MPESLLRPVWPTSVSVLLVLMWISRFINSKDPSLSIYVSPLCSLMSKDDQAIFHLFRTSTLFMDYHFVQTAFWIEGACPTIILDVSTREVLRWHYKDSIIRSWGGIFLASFLQSFQNGRVDLVAWATDSDHESSDYSDEMCWKPQQHRHIFSE